jgi:hypothetical protein
VGCQRASLRLPSSIVNAHSDYPAARDTVAAYHEKHLTELLAHVADAVDRFRAGDIDAFAAEDILDQFHRAAGALWKFCWAGSGAAHTRSAAQTIEQRAASGQDTDWWQRGARRRR